MSYFSRSFYPLVLIFSLCLYVNSCKNFLVQHCTDIPIAFNSISSIKCIQLIPNQFDILIDYSVQNYIITKSENCYNIVSYNSSLTTLFSNECREQCPEQYCLLFDNQPNTSIINIFYSDSSTYQSNEMITTNILSYDYLVFDDCSSANRGKQILLIIVYVLCGIVSLLAIIVIAKYIASWRLKKRSPVYEPYNWRWIFDCLTCEIHRDDQPPNREDRTPNGSNMVERDNLPRVNDNQLQLRNNLGASNHPYMIPTSSSNNTREQRNNGGDSSGNSSEQRYRVFSSEPNTPTLPRHLTTGYYGAAKEPEYDDSLTEIENDHRPPPLSLIQKLSSKASAVLSVIPMSNDYTTLDAQPSEENIFMRF